MNSIRSRLTVTLLAGVFLLLLVAGIVLLFVMRSRLIAEFDRGLETKARTLVALTSLEERRIEVDYDDDLLPEFDDEEDDDDEGEGEEDDDEDEAEDDEDEDEGGETVAREYFALYLHNGALIGKSPSLSKAQPLAADMKTGEERVVRNFDLPDGRPGRLIQVRFAPKIDVPDPGEVNSLTTEDDEIVYTLPDTMSEQEARVVLVVAVGRERLEALLASLQWTVAIVIGLLLAFIGALVWALVRIGFRPLEDLNTQLTAIGPESLDERVSLPEAADELTGIVATLNGLLDRVESGFARERRFSSDVAHELRTPVTELLSACEVGGKWPEDPAACRQLFNDIRDVADQMRNIVETLLELSRCDNGTATVEKESVELHGLVAECWAHTNGQPGERGMTLDNSIGPEHRVESDARKLRMIVQNLIDNAVAHGNAQGVVTCSATRRNGSVDLVLRNEAGDMEPGDVPRVFDRFWQGDEARSASDRFGLGLPIVKALAGALGHPVKARLVDSVFEVHLEFRSAAPEN